MDNLRLWFPCELRDGERTEEGKLIDGLVVCGRKALSYVGHGEKHCFVIHSCVTAEMHRNFKCVSFCYYATKPLTKNLISIEQLRKIKANVSFLLIKRPLLPKLNALLSKLSS